ncbi:STAS domain-containing protein [Streptomyces sp. JW3]|uniref:STAS domain-containing protein n=1 Tax=Streptomyces sp. JW3 TaxID=3456955 RepID=UPI003FA482C0
MTFLPPPGAPYEPPGSTVLALPPEIDFCNAPGLLPLILEAAGRRPGADPLRLLVLDLTGTVFMDSQGVRLLDEVRHRLPGRVGLRLVAAPHGVPSRVLELSGLRRDIPVHDNVAEALGRAGGAVAWRGARGF